ALYCGRCSALLPASVAEVADPLIGSMVGGCFRIPGVLGEGGMARVYSAEQIMRTAVRRVAVKMLINQHAINPKVVERFVRELARVRELYHLYTNKSFDYCVPDSGELYIAMELLTGESLETALMRGPLSPDRADHILAQVCGSLQEAHEKVIVHRDLKPANIY